MVGSEIYRIYMESLDDMKDIIDGKQHWREAAQRDDYMEFNVRYV